MLKHNDLNKPQDLCLKQRLSGDDCDDHPLMRRGVRQLLELIRLEVAEGRRRKIDLANRLISTDLAGSHMKAQGGPGYPQCLVQDGVIAQIIIRLHQMPPAMSLHR